MNPIPYAASEKLTAQNAASLAEGLIPAESAVVLKLSCLYLNTGTEQVKSNSLSGRSYFLVFFSYIVMNPMTR